MFLEDEDWNDGKGDVPNPVVTTGQEASSPNVKSKTVGKKSLLRTLQMLGPMPEWKSETPKADSESDTESPTQHAKKRRKKHRRKRRHSETEEKLESTEHSQRETQEANSPKKSRKEKTEKTAECKTTSTTKDLAVTKPGQEPTEDPAKKLNRKQWKNKMKNKRKCKNKFRSKDEASEEKEMKESDQNGNITKQNSLVQEVEKKKGKRVKSKSKSSDELKQSKPEDKSIKPVIKEKSVLSKEARMKKEKLRKLFQSTHMEAAEPVKVADAVVVTDAEQEAVKEEAPDPSASLRARMEQRLESARFRYINEVLYSSTSGEARRMFKQDPQSFWVYHRGYSAQVQRWPNNPVDNIIQFIQKKPSSMVVADFGCGDCKIAKSVKNKVHSFDLVATCELVTACDMANVPLPDSSVDIAVFCLSLMGTNLADFLKEANRVLKMGGFLKIAEVSSRFDNVRSFLTALASLGFKLMSKDTENTHFYSFDFVKTGPAPETVKKFGLELKPCVYKKR